MKQFTMVNLKTHYRTKSNRQYLPIKNISKKQSMNWEHLLFFGTTMYVIDVLNDGKYSSQLKLYKKHAKLLAILFGVFSMHRFVKTRPYSESMSFLENMNSMIRFMPIDRNTKEMISPFLSMSNNTGEARILTSGGESSSRSVSGSKKKWVAANQGWKCFKCQQQLDAWFEIDHTIRLADGGTNEVNNLTALCRNCHGKKTMTESL